VHFNIIDQYFVIDRSMAVFFSIIILSYAADYSVKSRKKKVSEIYETNSTFLTSISRSSTCPNDPFEFRDMELFKGR